MPSMSRGCPPVHISVKGIENCAYFGAGTNKFAKILGTFRNNVYLCSVSKRHVALHL